MDNRSVEIIINAKDQASATLGKISGELKSLGSSASKYMGEAVQTASRLAVGGIAAAGAAAYSSVKAFEESENSVAQLNAVLASTKGVAGVTAQAATEMASALQKVTKFSDEEVLSAENMLLTFTNIGKDVFPEATSAVLDMATAMGTDLAGTSIQVGKALQDPVRGVTALQRVGVRLTDSQKDLVQKMVDVGDTAGAQKLILKELQTEFGGSAKAAGETFAGKLAILKNQFGELQEKVGGFLANALSPLAAKLLEVVGAIDMNAVLDKLKTKFMEVAQSIKPFIDPLVSFVREHKAAILDFLKTFGITLAALIPVLALAGLAVTVLSNPLVQIGIVIAVLIGLWKVFGKQVTAFYQSAIVPLAHWIAGMLMPSLEALGNTIKDRLWPAIKQLWDALQPGLLEALKILAAVVGVTIIAAIWLFINGLNVVVSVISWLIRLFADVITWIGNFIGVMINAVNTGIQIWNAFYAVISAIFSQIWQYATTVFNAIAAVVSFVVGVIVGAFKFMLSVYIYIFDWIKALALVAFNAIWQYCQPVVNAIVGAWQWVGNVLNGIFNWILGVARGAWSGITGAASSAWNGIVGVWQGVYGFFSGIGNHIGNAVGGAFRSLGGIAGGAFEGIKSTVTGAINWVIDKVNGAINSVNRVADKVPGAPHIGNIPRLATGTEFFGGGLAMVGENGRELVQMPRGSKVFNAQETQAMSSNASFYGDIHLGDASAVREFFDKIGRNQDLARQGLTTMGY